jgi:hypothetical protein
MSRFRSSFSVYLLIGLMTLGVVTQTNAQQGVRNERAVRDVVRSLNSKIDDFRYTLDNEFARNSVAREEETRFNDDLRDFEASLRQFEDKLERRRENTDDVTKVLSAAKIINESLAGKRFGVTVDRDWTSIRGLLERLASNYQLAWNWENEDQRDPPYYPHTTNTASTRPNSAQSYGLTGTYKLNRARSENTRDIAENAIRNNGSAENGSSQRGDLEQKLEAPEQVMLDVRGSQVTLGSSNAPQITFVADGRDRTENLSNGKRLRVRSTLRGQELTVSSLGGDTDYTITFASIENGKVLRVTRRITTDYLRQTVFAESIYEKTDSTARLETNPNYNNGDYSSNDAPDNRTSYPTVGQKRTGDFIVPNGTIITAILEKDIDTQASQNNDRFELVVQAPNQYRGAIIEGYISGVNRSGKISGSSKVTFNFERIRLSNGQNYQFAGFLQSVTDENGEQVKVDTEGTAKGDSQTKETVKRGGIGAGVGAIIGAIAGGAKGAAIGAIIGGGAGAGSVVLQGKEDLKLRAGSSVTVQASAPNR